MKTNKEKYGKFYRGDGDFHLNFLGLDKYAVGALTIKRLEKHVAAFHRGEEDQAETLRALQTLRKMVNEALDLTENHVLFLLFDVEKRLALEAEEQKKYERSKRTMEDL